MFVNMHTYVQYYVFVFFKSAPFIAANLPWKNQQIWNKS